MVPWAYRAYRPNRSSIESAVFPEFTVVTNGQNDDGTVPVPVVASVADAVTRLVTVHNRHALYTVTELC